MKNLRLEALLIAVGLFLLGYMVKTGITDFKDKERIVTVKGLAEMEVPADKVTWPLMYKAIGNDLPVLYNNISEKNKVIVDFLKQSGISDEEISIAAPEVVDMQAERYSSNPPAFRYNATSVVTVSTKQVDKVRKLMSE